MLDYETALELLEQSAETEQLRLNSESVHLRECLGRWTADNVNATEDNPRFANSAMDGFAVCAAETVGASETNPVLLKVLGCYGAGESVVPLAANQGAACWEIMTGAPIPGLAFDAVIRLEDIRPRESADGTRFVEITRAINVGENIRSAGADFRSGELLVPAGTRLDLEHVLSLATTGITAVKVRARPRLIILSTGNELVPFDQPQLRPEQIRNSTAPFLEAAFRQFGCEVIEQVYVSDNAAATQLAFEQAIARRPDIIVSTGGVSVGKFDHVPTVLNQLQARILFHKVAIRPGKPILAAKIPQGPMIFGLPGNPISVAVGFRFFVVPYLRRLFGAARERPATLPLKGEVSKPAGLKFFQRATIEKGQAKVLHGQASFMLKALLLGQGWSVGNAVSDRLAAGEEVDWYSLWGAKW